MLKSFFAKIYANHIAKKVKNWVDQPVKTQEKTFQYLIAQAKNTAFGKDHQFDQINSYSDFKKKVPVRDYEALKGYVERIKNGEQDILWKGSPSYFAKTSGTTSGAKYIPITDESMKYQVAAAKEALLLYINNTGNAAILLMEK